MNNQPSRFITYPDTVDKSNHTVILVDATLDDVANLATFCSLSNKDYDIYLYKGDQDDLEWLNYISERAEQIFIRNDSQVTATSSERYSNIDTLREYFTKIDAEPLTAT